MEFVLWLCLIIGGGGAGPEGAGGMEFGPIGGGGGPGFQFPLDQLVLDGELDLLVGS